MSLNDLNLFALDSGAATAETTLETTQDAGEGETAEKKKKKKQKAKVNDDWPSLPGVLVLQIRRVQENLNANAEVHLPKMLHQPPSDKTAVDSWCQRNELLWKKKPKSIFFGFC